MRIWEWTRTCVNYLLATTIKNPSLTRLKISDNCYLRVIAYDKRYHHHILVIQGGIRHFNDDTPHYIKLLTTLLRYSNDRSSGQLSRLSGYSKTSKTSKKNKKNSKTNNHVGYDDSCHCSHCSSSGVDNITDSNSISSSSSYETGYNIFHLEKLDAVVNFDNQIADINLAVDYLHRYFIRGGRGSDSCLVRQPTLTILGFSMGGVSVLSYLAANHTGSNQGMSDNRSGVRVSYITVCSPINLRKLYRHIIHEEAMFRRLCQQQMAAYASSDINDLCAKYGTSLDEVINKYEAALSTIRQQANLLCLIASQDVITSRLPKDVEEMQLHLQCQLVNIVGATHCCELCIVTLVRILQLAASQPHLSLVDISKML